MNTANLHWQKFWQKNRFSFLALVMIGITVIGYTVYRINRALQFEGQWAEFDSQDYMHGENNPDGFRLEFPQSWVSGAFDGGGQKNLGDLRARFEEEFFIFTPNTYLSIWWRRVDETWTLEDVRDWYIDDLGFGINHAELEQQRNLFREITVGACNYPALSQDFWQGPHSGKRIILLIVGDEAFVLDLNAPYFDAKTTDTFDRMLRTFEVYK